MDSDCVPNPCVMQLSKPKPLGDATTRHVGTPWSCGGAVLPCRVCAGESISPFPLLFLTLLFWHIRHPPHECKTPLPWLAEWNANGCGARGEQQCFSGLKAAPVSWEHGLIIGGGNLALANVHLKSSAVKVLKHFRIILPTIWGFYRLGLLSTEGGQSVSEGALKWSQKATFLFVDYLCMLLSLTVLRTTRA